MPHTRPPITKNIIIVHCIGLHKYPTQLATLVRTYTSTLLFMRLCASMPAYCRSPPADAFLFPRIKSLVSWSTHGALNGMAPIRKGSCGERLHSINLIIHSGYFYKSSSSPLLHRSAPATARILCRSLTPKRHRQL